MTPDNIMQIQNEVYTKIVMDELQRQKKAGTKIGDYLLDKYEIDKKTAERLKQISYFRFLPFCPLRPLTTFCLLIIYTFYV